MAVPPVTCVQCFLTGSIFNFYMFPYMLLQHCRMCLLFEGVHPTQGAATPWIQLLSFFNILQFFTLIKHINYAYSYSPTFPVATAAVIFLT